MIASRDSQIKTLTGRVKYAEKRLEKKDICLVYLLRELNEALNMIYPSGKADSAEQMLRDYLSDNGMYHEKIEGVR